MFVFGEFELDGDGRQLRRRSGAAFEAVEAPPKVLALLRVLLQSAPRVVTRAELVDVVWQGQRVSASAVNTVVKLARQILGDSDQSALVTVHGIGYAYAAPVGRRLGGAGKHRLVDVRHELFVGRSRELATLSELVDPASSAGLALVWIHAPGGMGKTALAARFEATAVRRALPIVAVTCAHVHPTPETLQRAVIAGSGSEEARTVGEALGAYPRGVLLLDGYEAFTALDDWVRERLLPMLPSGWTMILSGRRPPGLRWRLDPVWTSAVEIALGELAPGEADELLARRGLGAADRASILGWSSGHPLTLVLAAESLRGRAGKERGDALLAALVEELARDAPTPTHRVSLECLAIVDALDEATLAAMLEGDPLAPSCFDWLTELAMVQARPEGLVLHELPRRALLDGLAWRSADRMADLTARAFAKRLADLALARWESRRRQLVHSLWRLKGLHPGLGPLVQLAEGAAVPRTEERAAIARRIEQFEGAKSATVFRRHLEADRLALRVLRRPADGALLGYSALLDVRPHDSGARRDDPVLEVLDARVGHPRERYSVLRWFADVERYHEATPVALACHMMNAEEHLATVEDDAGFSFALVGTPDAWAPLVRVSGFDRSLPDFVDGASSYAIFGRSWRARPLMDWLRALADQVVSGLRSRTPIEVVAPAGPPAA